MHHNLKFIILLFVIFLVSESTIQGQRSISLEDIFEDNLFETARVPNFKFMLDGQHYSDSDNQYIGQFDITTGEVSGLLFDATQFKGQNGFPGTFDSYSFSEDEVFILLETKRQQIYRRSSKAFFWIFDRRDLSLTPVFPEDKHQYATMSPDGKHVAFVYDNNLYVRELETGNITQITKDGKYNHIINGAADWVYEEEFGFAKAFKWSPDGQRIAWMRFDESAVPEFTMTNYRDELYPRYVTFKYPKVGETNSTVSIHVFHLDKSAKTDIFQRDNSKYIPRFFWTHQAEQLCIFEMNRHQNKLDLWLVNSLDGNESVLISESDKYYIDIHDNIEFLDDGQHFIWTSEKDGFNHIYLYNLNGEELKDLTPGDYDITEVYGYDDKRDLIYYQAASKDPLNREIFSVSLDGETKVIHDQEGWNYAQFSSTFDYYVYEYSNVNTPTNYVVNSNNGESIRVLEENAALKRRMTRTENSPVEFFNFTSPDNVVLNGWMIKPADFNPNKKYPVFMFLYGGPGSQQVTNRWSTRYHWWFQMLAQKGVIVACVDNRGTGARGSEFKKMTYLKLGHYETIDQIAAARYLATLDYTDIRRIGIFGWSYGGFMSSLCVLKGNDVFKMAIAVAPVTNWRWYDTIYTERYMRTEDENPEGYRENSPIYFANRLNGDYLLVHGLSDDNVHPQHSIEMSRALVEAGKQFDTYLYPNNSHGIRGEDARIHLFTKMTHFIYESFGIE